MREYRHAGSAGWLVGSVIAALAVIVGTPALMRQGPVPVLIFLAVMLPLVGWALRVVIQTATVRLVLTEDGHLERHGTFVQHLRIPVRRIWRLERAVIEDRAVLTIRYDLGASLDWSTVERELSDLVARIEAANPDAVVVGKWWGRPDVQH